MRQDIVLLNRGISTAVYRDDYTVHTCFVRVSTVSVSLSLPLLSSVFFLCPILLYLSWFISPLSSRAPLSSLVSRCFSPSFFSRLSTFLVYLSSLWSCFSLQSSLSSPLVCHCCSLVCLLCVHCSGVEGGFVTADVYAPLQPPHLIRCLVHLLHINLGAFVHHCSLSQQECCFEILTSHGAHTSCCDVPKVFWNPWSPAHQVARHEKRRELVGEPRPVSPLPVSQFETVDKS